MTADSSLRKDRELMQLASEEASQKRSHYYYSMDPQARVIGASAERSEITVELSLDQQCGDQSALIQLDEGMVATAADFWTSVVISAVSGGRQSVTTSLTVQTTRARVRQGVRSVRVVCRATSADESAAPAASAMFVDPEDPEIVYATVLHSKAWKKST
ncbi:hypothetical protein LPJ72_000214 [Coemansia sp. Benny D160-2]|nr:hypothetical protein LPJ72_000214 [Coemansia sp. Benny D160-2]